MTADYVLHGIDDGQIVLDDLANTLSGLLHNSVQRWIEDGLMINSTVEIRSVTAITLLEIMTSILYFSSLRYAISC